MICSLLRCHIPLLNAIEHFRRCLLRPIEGTLREGTRKARRCDQSGCTPIAAGRDLAWKKGLLDELRGKDTTIPLVEMHTGRWGSRGGILILPLLLVSRHGA